MASSAGVWKLVRVGVVVFLVILSALAWLGRKTKIGTTLQITSKEAVNYSGTATEQDAQSLGRALQEAGYFDGQSEVDVLLNKGDAGVAVSFVLQGGKWDDSEIVAGFESLGRQIASSVGGPPFALNLIDDKLNTKKSLTINNAETRFKHTEQELIRYFDRVTEDDARKLGQALQTVGYFDNTSPVEVLLNIENGGFAVSFVVQDGSWNDAGIVAQYEAYGSQIAPTMGAGPLVVNMVDQSLQTQWTTSVSADVTEPPVVDDPAPPVAEPQEGDAVMSQDALPPGPLPSDDEAKALAKKYILAIGQGLHDKDMTAFHALLSTALQGLVTPEVLHSDFEGLSFKQVDLTAITSSEIEFDPSPSIDDDGELGLSGRFQSADTEVRFVTNYLYEAEQWKLRRFTVNAIPNDETIPAADKLQQLVMQSLLKFSESIQAKDFTEFHGTVSETMRHQFEAEDLTEAFGIYILMGLDLASVRDTELTFSPDPFINDEGALEINGLAPLAGDLQFVYRITYVREGTEWKLIGIRGNIVGG